MNFFSIPPEFEYFSVGRFIWRNSWNIKNLNNNDT